MASVRTFYSSDVEALHSDWMVACSDLEAVWTALSEANGRLVSLNDRGENDEEDEGDENDGSESARRSGQAGEDTASHFRESKVGRAD